MKKLSTFFIVVFIIVSTNLSYSQMPEEPPFKDIFFDKGDFRLREDVKPVLKENAEVLMDNPDLHILVEGCYNKKEYAANSKLGQQRAESVMTYLVELGIKSHRISLMTRCNKVNEQRGLLSKHLDEDWQLDNRVHFIEIKAEEKIIGLKTTSN